MVPADLARNTLLVIPLALVAGVHASTWGAFKDAPYEGYHRVAVSTFLAAGALLVAGSVLRASSRLTGPLVTPPRF